MRVDRALTLYGYDFLGKFFPEKGKRRIPILMYHSVTDTLEPHRNAYYKINISPNLFAEQIKFLVHNNYKIISLQHLEEYRSPSGTTGEKVVVLTFDDGYENWYTHAFPILREYHATATMFVTTDFIGYQNKVVDGNIFLNWSQIREMQAAGITFGSHTASHPQLSEIPYPQVEHELRESKQILEKNLQCPITTFAYPFAFPETKRMFKKRFEESLRQCGYKQAVTTIIGTNSAAEATLLLKRLPINQEDDLNLFQAKLHGFYNWVHFVQLMLKTTKSLLKA